MQGLLVVVSGFSGVGKGTLMKELLKRYPEEYALSISATSRAPREGETDGVEYFFKTREEFEKMLSEDALLEYTQYNGNYYGTPKEFVHRMLKSGKNVILEIEVEGALQIRAKFPDTYLLYVVPPTAASLLERLRGRGTESQEVIMKRMERAIEEAEYISSYDHISINDDFETCLLDIHKSIKDSQIRLSEIDAYEKRIRQELTELIKGE